jgi:hypothetical protein
MIVIVLTCQNRNISRFIATRLSNLTAIPVFIYVWLFTPFLFLLYEVFAIFWSVFSLFGIFIRTLGRFFFDDTLADEFRSFLRFQRGQFRGRNGYGNRPNPDPPTSLIHQHGIANESPMDDEDDQKDRDDPVGRLRSVNPVRSGLQIPTENVQGVYNFRAYDPPVDRVRNAYDRLLLGAPRREPESWISVLSGFPGWVLSTVWTWITYPFRSSVPVGNAGNTSRRQPSVAPSNAELQDTIEQDIKIVKEDSKRMIENAESIPDDTETILEDMRTLQVDAVALRQRAKMEAAVYESVRAELLSANGQEVENSESESNQQAPGMEQVRPSTPTRRQVKFRSARAA